MNMLDIFKKTLQDGMKIERCKELSNKYKITLSYNGMYGICELSKTCTPGKEEFLCKQAINIVISGMYLENGNHIEAKAWLDGEKWGSETTEIPELATCPFCGRKAYLTESENFVFYLVRCGYCAANTDEYRNPKDAVEAWNQRV